MEMAKVVVCGNGKLSENKESFLDSHKIELVLMNLLL